MQNTRITAALALLALSGTIHAHDGVSVSGADSTLSHEVLTHLERIERNEHLHHVFRARLLKLLPLIAEGSPVDIVLTSSKGNTALHYACAIGDVELVSTLLRLGASTKIRTHRGALPRDCADGPRRRQILALLDNQESNSTAVPAPQPEQAASQAPPLDISNHIAADSELESVISHVQSQPASNAAEYQHKKELLKLLHSIKNGKNINYTAPGTHGYTALHHACSMGDFYVAIWLLEHGADTHARTHGGKTPGALLHGPNASFIRSHLLEFSEHNQTSSLNM